MSQSLDVTRQTLEETPVRALAFLRGAGTWRSIRRALATRGYTSAEHDLGWKLLLRCSTQPQAGTATADEAVRDAIAELDATDEPLFRATAAALDRLHPEQGAFVFADLAPATGAAAVVSMATFLDRLDALEASPERKATRAADRAALATLATRGLTADERARLRALVDVAMNVDAAEDDDGAATDVARTEDLGALRKWHLDWAATARAVIKRRDELVRLGLAQRRRRAKDAPADPAAPVSPAAPAPGGDAAPSP